MIHVWRKKNVQNWLLVFVHVWCEKWVGNTWRVLLRKNIRNRHLTVWWCMMQHAHVSSTYVIIHYLEYNCESPSSTYGGPTRSAVRHSSVTPIICSYQINVSKFQVADHAAHLCRCFDWGPTARRIFFHGPWEKNIHENWIQLDKQELCAN